MRTSQNGISKKESLLRQKKYGFNEIKQRNVDALSILVRQFKSPFFFLLFIAAVVALIIGERIDSYAILAFVALNVTIGFFQEFKAERAIFLLQKFVPQKVKVVRGGKEEIIEAKFLVQGDIVLLSAGDKVPADLRLTESYNLLADESILTGESLPAPKISDVLKAEQKEIFRAENIAFSGTSIISGKAQGAVVAAGKETVFGEIAKNISNIKRESAYEKNILYFCRLVLKIVVVTILLVFIANILLKGFGNFFELTLFSLALIVSILPEALPAVVTFALAQGSLKMAKQHVVVKRLSSIEDLGNIEILCADKTGTLTQNKLSLEKIISSDRNKCFLYGILSFSKENPGQKLLNPFDRALFLRAGADIIRNSEKFKIISENPFDAFRMKSSVLAESRNSERFLIVKGAPEFILKDCSKFSGHFDRKEIKEDLEREGNEGRRVLAIAFKKVPARAGGKGLKTSISAQDEKGLTFLGYFVFADPLKATAKEAIELSKKLGVKIKIITGDSKEVAFYIAKKAGLALSLSEVASGEELLKELGDDFDAACEDKVVFARISPDLKQKIIRSLQKKYAVGFLGEGVNDAPALKTANVGIAVAESSDIAKDASDIVLLEKDLKVLVSGIKDGRAIFSNINKYIKCALASNFGNFYSIAVISLFINFLPMLPVQILLGNILSDFPLISIATDSVDVDELKRPKLYQLHNVLPLIISLALVSTVFDFIFFAIFFKQQPAIIQTLWYIESILTEILLIFVIRTRGRFWKAVKPSFWLMFLVAIDAVFIVALPFLKIGQSWFHFVALPVIPLLIVILEVIAYFWVSEFVKLVYFKYFKPKGYMLN